MKAPERIYCDCHHSWDKDPKNLDKGVEYIRSDLAKDFADYALSKHIDYLLGNDERKDVEELFKEFINSRKAKKG